MSNYSPKHPGSGASGGKKPVKGSKLNKALIIAILSVLAIIIAAAMIAAAFLGRFLLYDEMGLAKVLFGF